MDSYQLRYCLTRSVEGYTAVCAIDQLKYIRSESFSIIVNNEPSTSPGMHWIALHKPQHANVVEFFDSFALPTKFYGKEIQCFLQKNGTYVETSTAQYQSDLSNVCGNFCLYFLVLRSKGVSFTNVLSSFSLTNLKHNDELVTHFVSKNYKFPHFANCGEFCDGHCMNGIRGLTGVCVQKNSACSRLDGSLHRSGLPGSVSYLL